MTGLTMRNNLLTNNQIGLQINSLPGGNIKPKFNHNSFTGNGYLVYGLPTPTGSLSLTNVASTFGHAAVNCGAPLGSPSRDGPPDAGITAPRRR